MPQCLDDLLGLMQAELELTWQIKSQRYAHGPRAAFLLKVIRSLKVLVLCTASLELFRAAIETQREVLNDAELRKCFRARAAVPKRSRAQADELRQRAVGLLRETLEIDSKDKLQV